MVSTTAPTQLTDPPLTISAPVSAPIARPARAAAPLRGTAPAQPPRPAQPRRRRGRGPAPSPLGSLTQRRPTAVAPCPRCASASVTVLSMTLTDGSPAQLRSCRTCGHRTWSSRDDALSFTDVLARTARP